MRYYFIIKYLPEDKDDNFLASKLIKLLHGYNRRYSLHSIGVSFPCWSENSVGEKIAFVCRDSIALQRLALSKEFMLLNEYKVIDISKILPVLEEGNTEGRFIRNRRIDKYSPKGKQRIFKRLTKRALQRGKEYYQPTYNTESIFMTKPYHQIQMSSLSTGQTKFNFNVQLEVCEEGTEPSFNTYGFSSTNEWRGSVPLKF